MATPITNHTLQKSPSPGISESLPDLLRKWRSYRRLSQPELACAARVSQRSLAAIESGRLLPEKSSLLKIAEALELPLRDRNLLFIAAGYRPIYPERQIDAHELTRSRMMIARVLNNHEPYPAILLDQSWNVLMRNEAAKRILRKCIDENRMSKLSPDGRLNLLRLMFHPDGMRRHIRNWDQAQRAILSRVRCESIAYPGSPSERLLQELLSVSESPQLFELQEEESLAISILEISIEEEVLRLSNMQTVFTAPNDVTLQGLRIELSFPADDSTDALLRDWAT